MTLLGAWDVAMKNEKHNAHNAARDTNTLISGGVGGKYKVSLFERRKSIGVTPIASELTQRFLSNFKLTAVFYQRLCTDDLWDSGNQTYL